MSLTDMYPAKNNSPSTTLASGINSTDTSMTVGDASVLPAAPNIAVIGSNDSAEIVKYTAINDNTLTIVRGQNGTVPGVWAAGSPVARNFTALDHEAFRQNILDLESRKIEGIAWGDVTGTLSNQTDLKNALDAKAPLASPALTGTPTAPTATAGTNSTQIATTAFATGAINSTHDQILTVLESMRGKKVSFIGDSITSYDGYVPDGYSTYYPNNTLGVTDVSQTWWWQMLNFTGASLEVNASYSGSCATNKRGSGFPTFYDRCNTSLLGSPDVIIVALGTNDDHYGAPLGDYDFETAYTSLSVTDFIPAYTKGVKALQALYPNVKIICVSLYMAKPFATAIKTIAETLGCEYANAGDYRREYTTHPGVTGMKEIALRVMTSGELYADGSDTGWKSIPNPNTSNYTGTIYYRKNGNIVTVTCYRVTLKSALSSNARVFVEAADSPLKEFPPFQAMSYPAGNKDAFGQMVISSGGAITFYKYGGDNWPTDRYINFIGFYPV